LDKKAINGLGGHDINLDKSKSLAI
jgi:hypothetical protein